MDYRGKILVKGKGKKERYVYLTERARKYLNKYMGIRRDKGRALFVPFKDLKENPDQRLSAKYLSGRIVYYRNKLGLGKISSHSFRHGYATYLAESGASPVGIQTLLGHSSVATTDRYINTSDKFAEETHWKYHPLSSKAP